jgi:hypothetical protein
MYEIVLVLVVNAVLVVALAVASVTLLYWSRASKDLVYGIFGCIMMVLAACALVMLGFGLKTIM